MSAPSEPVLTLFASLALSLAAYKLTATLVPLLGPDLVAKGLGGFDMLKPGFRREGDAADTACANGGAAGEVAARPIRKSANAMLPEATGVIGASVYILLLSLFAPLPYLSHLLPATPTAFPTLNMTSSTHELPVLLDGSLVFPHHSFATYLASLLSLLTATFLGFLDDVFDIRWRWKLPIPVIASVPLLVTYAAGHGVTDIVLPKLFGLRKLLDIEGTSGVVHLGPIYYLYMSMLSTFCTNSINILAGVNGVEVGQALVIALSITLNDLLYVSADITLLLPTSVTNGEPYIIGAGLARGSTELADRHLFSLYFMLPLIGVCLGLLKHNWYPARAFIGDTFCYFSGMAFAVVGILGHFSKTLLLFFLPQIFNFIYSTPQLFGLVPCPRHRLPRLNEATGLLEPSFAALDPSPSPSGPSPTASPTTTKRKIAILLIELLGALHLVRVVRDARGKVTGCSNLTILNLILVTRGPMKEDRLTMWMLGVQVAGSAVAFGVRYGVAGVFYDASRR